MIVYEDLRYGFRRPGILTSNINERLQNTKFVIFFCPCG